MNSLIYIILHAVYAVKSNEVKCNEPSVVQFALLHPRRHSTKVQDRSPADARVDTTSVNITANIFKKSAILWNRTWWCVLEVKIDVFNFAANTNMPWLYLYLPNIINGRTGGFEWINKLLIISDKQLLNGGSIISKSSSLQPQSSDESYCTRE